ncbi:MAG: hypothetical protein KKE23_01065, partial [Nanoarchaeota archaeon]|nr:hypothetical protein [Nanoarchaeota archaeon]
MSKRKSFEQNNPASKPLCPSTPQLRQPTPNYSYTESRRASAPAARPEQTPPFSPVSLSSQSSSQSSPKPAGGYASLFSNIAKEGMSNKENQEFLQKKFPNAQTTPASLSGATNPQAGVSFQSINKIISNRINSNPVSPARPSSTAPKGAAIGGLFSSMAQESIAFQDSKKQGFVQSFGPTPREGSQPIINQEPPKPKEKPELSKREIVWLSEIQKGDVLIGGGKGANLAEMYNLKL